MEDFAEAARRIRASGAFQSGWYRRSHPDVAASGLDPVEHYLRYGAALGRDPSRHFDTRRYLSQTPEAAAPGVNPLLHFLDHGGRPGPTAPRADQRIARLRQLHQVLGFETRPLRELTALADADPDPATRARALREIALWTLRDGDPAAPGATAATAASAAASGSAVSGSASSGPAASGSPASGSPASGPAVSSTPGAAQRALDLFARARALAPPLKLRQEILVTELIALYRLGEAARAEALWQEACLAGEFTPDAALARVNFAPSPEARLLRINGLLALQGLAPVALLPAAPGLSAYDRLCAGPESRAGARRGPLVSVLLAAHQAGATLPTALRALAEQSWADLEVLILDDASPGPETAALAQGFAARDPRFRLIRMERNGGAYLARNRGLREARGDYVTLHDADDWAHPERIAHQIARLQAEPRLIACTTKQARADGDLRFLRWSGTGKLFANNISSLTFRRAPVVEALGGWDSVRLSADSELMRRLTARFGAEALLHLDTGPFAFQRSSASSVVADPVLGMDGFLFGARKIYADLQEAHHARRTTRPEGLPEGLPGGLPETQSGALHEAGDPARRAFAAPALMRPERARLIAEESHFDLILGADLRHPNAALEESFAALAAAARAGSQTGGQIGGQIGDKATAEAGAKDGAPNGAKIGARIGLFELCRYDGAERALVTKIHPRVAERIEAEGWRILSYGETLSCGRLLLQGVDLLEEIQRYIPRIRAEEIRLRLSAPAPAEALSRAAAHLAAMFEGEAHWHPLDAEIRREASAAMRAAGLVFGARDWPEILPG